MKWLVVSALALCAVAGSTRSADAQYFGQNKVQYKKFDFKVLATDHFDIYYYPEEEAAVQLAARMAERWYARLSKVLQHDLSSRQPLILYAAHPHFQQTNVLAGEIGEGTGGVTESAKRRIILPFAGGLGETDHVLGHELVHAFQYDIAAHGGSPDQGGSAMSRLPLWFVEGMAEYLSIGPVDAHTAMWIRDASLREQMPSVDRLDDPDFFPYRYGHAFWAFVAGRWGDAAVGNMLRSAIASGDLDASMRSVIGIDEKAFTAAWHEDTRRTYAPFGETAQPPTAFGRALITRRNGGGDMNVSPSLSPDGRRVVFLSERSLFAIEMYVADAMTGAVTRKLVRTAGDAHFESLQFIESAGDWAPDNRRFVFAALAQGAPVLSIVDVDTGRREAEYAFADLDQIFNPAWSPDGRSIAFTAMKGGVLDLFVYDIERRQTTQLTSDSFADYDPEWAPSGRELAWVTDRFSANPATLQFGSYRIGLIDVASKQARLLAGFDDGRNTNPEFSADGATLFFIATPDGIPNVYRHDMATGATTGATNLRSGVSGITPLTPALSVSAAADRLVFTVFEDNEYNLYAADRASQLSTRATPSAERTAAALPPFIRPAQGDVVRLLRSPAEGLPPPQEYPEQEYRSRLSLDAITQPTIGVGADRFGAYAAGGLAMLWSDVLGNHELVTAVQVTNRFEEIGGAVAYINRKGRVNWGIAGEQTPYVSGSFAQGLTNVNGQTVIAEQTLRVTQINRGATGFLQFPFSRAHRVEVSGGARRISFDRQLETSLFSPITGQLLDESEQELSSPDTLNLGEAAGALVYDSSVFGATGPVLGQRYRFEYSQTAGSLLYSGVLADYRRYFMPVRPFTIAVRGLHYGRYGRDGDDGRLTPLFVGDPGLVRGYEIGSFEATECVASAASDCPVFDRLTGSRLTVASAELRFPLVGAFSRRTYYGPLPIEIAFFGDAGVAWTDQGEAGFLGLKRDWARSVGAAIRFNAFGYVIGEIDYVRPLDRPGRGWLWQFNFTPGF